MAKGLLLDFDGTLACSLSVMHDVYERFLAINGCSGNEDEFQTLNGPPLTEVVKQLRRRHQLAPSIDRLLRQYQHLLSEAQDLIQPNAGAACLLTSAHLRSYYVAVVTSADSSTVLAWLAKHDLRSLVTTVVGGDQVTCGKPDPEPYIRALALLNCDAHHSIAIEDSPIGASAAVAAGLRTYVLRSLSPQDSTWPKIAGFVDSLSAAIELLND